MPPPKKGNRKEAPTLREVIEDVGLYPPEAYQFLQEGLTHTVNSLHGPAPEPVEGEIDAATAEFLGVETDQLSRHVSGQQLCHGLRDYAQARWGMMAGVVLARWNITATLDFGRMVFALVDNGLMSKTDEDSIDDFRNVYDFRKTFDAGYRIQLKS